MNILLLSLNGDPLSKSPRTYGGAGRTLKLLAENLDNTYLAGEEKCFEGDLNEKTLPLSPRLISQIRDGLSVDGVLRDRHGFEFDLVVYADSGITLCTEKPQLCWSVGAEEKINPYIKHLLTHNLKWQKPVIQNPETKIHEFVLGIDIPAFEEYEKEDFLFNCGNQYHLANSGALANLAVKNKIKVIFAGPIDPNHRSIFLNEIDYKWATYIGQIDEAEKIKLMKKARYYIDLPGHHLNGPRLSTKMAWSYNCVVISTPMGIMPEVIVEGKNGYIIKNEDDLVSAVSKLPLFNQLDCFNTATQWSLDKMCKSFLGVVNEVIGNG